MDRREFLTTAGIGLATTVVAPKLWLGVEPMVAGRFGHAPYGHLYTKDRKTMSYGEINDIWGKVRDLRITVYDKISKPLGKLGKEFNRFQQIPASIFHYRPQPVSPTTEFYRNFVNEGWDLKHYVAETRKVMALPENEIYMKDNICYFRKKSTAEYYYNEFLNEIFELPSGEYFVTFNDLTCILQDLSEGLDKPTDKKWTIFFRGGFHNFQKPIVIAPEQKTKELIKA